MSNIQVVLNPVKQKLTLAYASQKPETVSISIKNIMGQTFYSEDVHMNDGFNIMEIQDIRDFIPGIYTLVLQTADRLFYSQRLVKN
jgi:hypothetical protein